MAENDIRPVTTTLGTKAWRGVLSCRTYSIPQKGLTWPFNYRLASLTAITPLLPYNRRFSSKQQVLGMLGIFYGNLAYCCGFQLYP